MRSGSGISLIKICGIWALVRFWRLLVVLWSTCEHSNHGRILFVCSVVSRFLGCLGILLTLDNLPDFCTMTYFFTLLPWHQTSVVHGLDLDEGPVQLGRVGVGGEGGFFLFLLLYPNLLLQLPCTWSGDVSLLFCFVSSLPLAIANTLWKSQAS